MEEFMVRLNEKVTVGLVGGSDFQKINEQLNGRVLQVYEHVFSENGLVYHKNGQLFSTKVRMLHYLCHLFDLLYYHS